MEYRGIDIDLQRERFYSKIPTDAHSGRAKDFLESKASVSLCIFGVPAQDEVFPFELRAILEEFIGKRLGQQHGSLNSNAETLGVGYELSVYREDSLLVVSVKDTDNGKLYISKFNMIHSKTLYSILSKAIQAVSI